MATLNIETNIEKESRRRGCRGEKLSHLVTIETSLLLTPVSALSTDSQSTVWSHTEHSRRQTACIFKTASPHTFTIHRSHVHTFRTHHTMPLTVTHLTMFVMYQWMYFLFNTTLKMSMLHCSPVLLTMLFYTCTQYHNHGSLRSYAHYIVLITSINTAAV